MDENLADALKIVSVFFLVAVNGFFVAAEFGLVALRRSRVNELADAKRRNAKALQSAQDHIDTYLAATQLGITIASLALGWIGEPALAHLVQAFLANFPDPLQIIASHSLAVAVSFILITVLHIVFGELLPKSLALQRSEATALSVIRPLWVFLAVFRPAIFAMNGMGNLILRLLGLTPGGVGETFHSPAELKLIVAASQEAGLLQPSQQEVVERVLTIGGQRINAIMTPRMEIDWIDLDDSLEDNLKIIKDCAGEQVLVGRRSIDEPLGMVLKTDLLDQMLAGLRPDPAALIREPLIIPESTSILRVLEQFRKRPVTLAIIVNEYGLLEGVVTPTDLLEAIAGELPDAEGEGPDIVERADGSYLIDGMMPAQEAFDFLEIGPRPKDWTYHTAAGFALSQLKQIPAEGDSFSWDGYRFEIVDMDGRRIDKMLVSRDKPSGEK